MSRRCATGQVRCGGAQSDPRGKPVVAFKIGRSEAGAAAAVSHTGAMAGADRMYDALFRQTGAIRAQSFSDLLDIPVALATGRKLRGNRGVAILNLPMRCVLLSDDLGLHGFDTPAMQATAQALRALQTGSEAVLDRNPIDVTLAGLRPAARARRHHSGAAGQPQLRRTPSSWARRAWRSRS